MSCNLNTNYNTDNNEENILLEFDYTNFYNNNVYIQNNISSNIMVEYEIDGEYSFDTFPNSDVYLELPSYINTVKINGYEYQVTDTINVTEGGEIFTNSFHETSWYRYMFEDIHPSLGDYDFNDYTFDIEAKVHKDHNNVPDSVSYEIIFNSMGTQKNYGLGVQFFTSSDQKFMNVAHGTVNNISDVHEVRDGRSFILVDNLKENVVPKYNTFIPSVNDQPDTLEFEFNIDKDLLHSSVGSTSVLNYRFFLVDSLYNEIQTVGIPPTQFANVDRLGTKDDASDTSGWNYSTFYEFDLPAPFYYTTEGYPWSLVIETRPQINIPTSNEYVPIYQSFPRFDGWVDSGGTNNISWFLFYNDNLVLQ